MTAPAPHPAHDDERQRFAALLAGQYELEDEIGRGGMGVVYRARDLRLDRPVAIKTLPPHLAADPVVRERFLREARTAARLSQQNIVPVHRADEVGGQVFFVMGLVDGESLAQRLREHGPLAPIDALRLLRDVALALEYAHAHGVIHRDVKPENILIDRESGRATVTDFGIARLAEASPLTATGQMLGTVHYASPEQVSGETVDARSDIYSLGVVGYYALCGRFPFDSPLASAVLVAHVTRAAPPLSSIAADVPRQLADVVDRCLAKDPNARYPSCAELVSALSAIEPEIEELGRAKAMTMRPLVSPPSLVSDTEAQAIFQRAAELQALTGVVPRPAPVASARDSARDAERTSGFSLDTVRGAAAEAGIPAQYVEHALVERGLARGEGTALATRRAQAADKPKRANLFFGSKTVVEKDIVLDGEFPERDYDLLIEIIQRHTGEAGHASGLGRSFSWQRAEQKSRNVQVSVVPRNGKTTIRVTENLNGAAGGVFGGFVGGAGGATGGVWIGIGAKLFHDPLVGVALWASWAGIMYLSARAAFRRVAKRRANDVEELAAALAAQARESIAAASPMLPRRP